MKNKKTKHPLDFSSIDPSLITDKFFTYIHNLRTHTYLPIQHTHTHTHAHTRAHTHSTHTHTRTHMHAHARTHSLTHAHTLTVHLKIIFYYLPVCCLFFVVILLLGPSRISISYSHQVRWIQRHCDVLDKAIQLMNNGNTANCEVTSHHYEQQSETPKVNPEKKVRKDRLLCSGRV